MRGGRSGRTRRSVSSANGANTINAPTIGGPNGFNGGSPNVTRGETADVCWAAVVETSYGPATIFFEMDPRSSSRQGHRPDARPASVRRQLHGVTASRINDEQRALALIDARRSREFV